MNTKNNNKGNYMQNTTTSCKTILTYISGMLTLAVILIGADLYQKKANSLCFNQSAPVEDISQLAGE